MLWDSESMPTVDELKKKKIIAPQTHNSSGDFIGIKSFIVLQDI